jgi:radical SAM enzyme (rSAM/lipoprotein system)
MGYGLRKRLSLDAFRLYRNVQSRLHELTYLFWECTLRCNLSCVHCGSDCTRDPGLADMPLKDFLKVLDGIAARMNPNRITVCLTGGEPTLRKDLAECGREIRARGFPWGFVTNGLNLPEERMHELLANGLTAMTISLDGLRDSHDWFRGRKGSFAQACNVIRNASRCEGLVFDVVTCVNRRNIDELPAMGELLQKLGARNWRIFTVFPKGRAADNVELSLSPLQWTRVMSFISESRAEGAIATAYGCEGFLGEWEGEVRNGLFYCRAGVNIGSVLADGSVSACPSLRDDYIQGSIYDEDFLDIWNERFAIMRNRGWTRSGKCKSCKEFKWCNGSALHLRDEKTGELLLCHLEKLSKTD